LSSDIDVEEAKAQLEATRAQLIDLGVQRAQYEHAIAVLVGVPATGFQIAERPLAGDPPPIPTGIPSQLLERRPDIAAAERRVASANALIGVARSTFFPTVMLGATGGMNSESASEALSPSSTMWSAGPSVNETIFDAGRRRAEVDYARAQHEQAVALYREQVLSAFRDVEDQLAALRVLEDEAAVIARAVDAAKKTTALSTVRYKRGLAPYLELLTNESIELNDERLAAALVSRRVVASTQLQMALGGGWSSTQLPKN
jgi:NodT family efflux transporter outer membrane factor (OMF) lipoprotein